MARLILRAILRAITITFTYIEGASVNNTQSDQDTKAFTALCSRNSGNICSLQSVMHSLHHAPRFFSTDAWNVQLGLLDQFSRKKPLANFRSASRRSKPVPCNEIIYGSITTRQWRDFRCGNSVMKLVWSSLLQPVSSKMLCTKVCQAPNRFWWRPIFRSIATAVALLMIQKSCRR